MDICGRTKREEDSKVNPYYYLVGIVENRNIIRHGKPTSFEMMLHGCNKNIQLLIKEPCIHQKVDQFVNIKSDM